MRRTSRPSRKPPIRRAVLALALVAFGFALGRMLPAAPAPSPTEPIRPPSVTAAAIPRADPPPSPESLSAGLWDGDALCASHCDLSRAAEQAFATHDPLADPLRFRVRVLRVVDGDTIRVLWHGRDTAVRLLRIDTPEVGQSGFREASDHLRQLIDGDFIDLEFEGRAVEYDRYGRLLAYLRKDGRNLNVEMRQSGHAAFYDRFGAGKYKEAFAGQWQNEAAIAARSGKRPASKLYFGKRRV